MKVTCDNCGAVYRIPEEKLTKEVSRATCKKCGNKIVIRKPSGSLGDHGLGSSYGFDDDDDSIVNHEERTVIATVPELQRFDATPPVSVPGAAHDVESTLGFDQSNAPTEAVQASQAAPQPISSPADAAPAPQAPRGVPIPGQMRLEVGSLPIIMVALGIVGTLFFVPDAIWGSSTLTAVGFGLALYGQLAVLMALLDLQKQRSPRPQMVFLVPAAVCILTFILLVMIQKKENIAFLKGEAPELVVLETGEPYTLPDGTEYVDVVMVDKETGKRKTVRKQVTKKMKKNAGGGATGLIEQQAKAGITDPTKNGGAGGIANSLMAGGRNSTGPKGLESQRVSLHSTEGPSQDQISAKVNSDEGVKRCVQTYGTGISGAIYYNVTLLRSGKVKDAGFPKSSVYRLSEFEKCLNDRVGRLTLPSYTGGKSEEVVQVKFIL